MTSGLEERIGTLLAQHRPELEQLVDQALERELAQLVEQRLAARNGEPVPTVSYPQVGNAATAATKVCNGCGETKPASEYERNRLTCRPCRRRQERERAARRDAEQEPAEPDRPAAITATQLAARAPRRYGNLGAGELERWLVGQRLAVRVDGGLAATGRAIELADSIDLSLATG